MSITVTDIAFIYHPVSDVARARAFYEGLLGLRTGDLVSEFSPGVWWIEYDIAGSTLAVSNAFPAAAGGGVSVALNVSDLDATLASVKAAGIALTIEPMDFAPCRMFGINSPDGHPVVFHQRKA